MNEFQIIDKPTQNGFFWLHSKANISLVSLMLLLGFLMFGGCGEISVSQIDGCEQCPAERCLRSKEGSSGRCVECVGDKHCQASSSSPTRKCLENQCVCGSDKDCPAGNVCGDPSKGKAGCVECTKNDDCKNAERPVCSYNECVICEAKQKRQCEPNGTTACSKGEQICQNSGTWGECKDYLLCKTGEKCVEEKCVPDCPEPPPCTEAGLTCLSKPDDVPGTFKECKKSAKGCFELSEEKKCGATEFCDKGSCIPFNCPKPECKLDETQCSSLTQFRICVKDKNGCLLWSEKKDCEKESKCRLAVQRCVVCEPAAKEACYSGAEGTKNKGICRAGERKCSDDGTKWGDCKDEVVPGVELCNGLDDDCNGQIDDSLMPEPCSNQTGSCKGASKRCDGAKGWLKCEDGDYRKIFKEYEAKEALCDGLDNDCDGQIDNGLAPKPCNKTSGVCAGTVEVCDGKNGWIACTDSTYTAKDPSYQATETKCDGKDNDCDGRVDETHTTVGNSCTEGLGECKRTGKIVCKADGSSGCSVAAGPKRTEICNGKDDDCDGQTDEGFQNLGNSCTVGVGECRRTGKIVCKSDGSAAVCSVSAGPKSTEICNRKDDDCDGSVDEGATCPRGSQCASGSCQTCSQPSSKCANYDAFCTSAAPKITCNCGFVSYCVQKSSSIFCSGCCAWYKCR